MIVYITNTFKEKFLKEFKTHHFSIEELVGKLKEISSIHIKEPIYKVRFYLHGIALRGFIVKKGMHSITPLCIFLKTSKEGGNLTLDASMAKYINQLLKIYEEDFLHNRFEAF